MMLALPRQNPWAFTYLHYIMCSKVVVPSDSDIVIIVHSDIGIVWAPFILDRAIYRLKGPMAMSILFCPGMAVNLINYNLSLINNDMS